MEELTEEEKRKMIIKIAISILLLVITTIIGIVLVA